ncbi:hypothetical protein Moror_6705 [Moniliophthora roreri MCA 2997]|uniref:Uncharacterized protein n=1 Tax=Moniliophthora roreri (strain MCA 2997) TaxID=1381753 RepID=V2XW26_MONRO|nr:hypothetical protein Moror_6705 [Moniliophthora roreri MCA 2997]
MTLYHTIIFHLTHYQGLPGPLKRSLLYLAYDEILRGEIFLKCNAGFLTSTCDGILIEENFSQLLIFELTGDRSLIHLTRDEDHDNGRWNFFQGKGQLTTTDFPYDLDTTSLGLTAVQEDDDIAMAVMDEMLDYLNEDGIIQTYFDHSRPRIDPVVCVNVLNLFFTYRRGKQMVATLQWVYSVLLDRAYIHGTRYYTTAESFLFFLCRMLRTCPDTSIRKQFLPLLKERIAERIGAKGDGLSLAMRVIVCNYVGLRDTEDYRTLVGLQQEDGGWDNGVLYKYGSSGLLIGNRGLTTAMALQAIRCYRAS